MSSPDLEQSPALQGYSRGILSPSPQPDPWLNLPREDVEDPQSQGVGAAVLQHQQLSAALSPGT